MSAKGQAWGWRERGWTKEVAPHRIGSLGQGYPPPANLKDRSWTWDGGGATLGWGQGAGESPGREHRGWEGANLAVQPEEDKHDEEEAGPQLGQGHHGHGLGEGDEGQARACRAHTASGRPVHTRMCTHVSACVCWLSLSTTLGSTISTHPLASPSALPWFWGPALCQALPPNAENFL